MRKPKVEGKSQNMRITRLLRLFAIGFLLTPATARAQTEEVIYYHTDAIGSVRMITDSSGTVLARYDYTPFGQPWSPPGTVEMMQFTGKERELQSELDYFNARDFMSLTGRFTTIDPGHLAGALDDPQTWNAYAYALNNPFRFVDPFGLSSCPPPTSTSTCVEGRTGSGDVVFDFPRWQMEAFFWMWWNSVVFPNPYELKGSSPFGPPIGGISSLIATDTLQLAVNAETSVLVRASQSAFLAAGRAEEFTLGAKHAAGAFGRWAKFAPGVNPNAVLREALTSPSARLLPNGANSFKVVTNLGRVIGSKGETAVRVVVDSGGHVVTWFPVR